MRKWTRKISATAPAIALLFGLACHDENPGFASPEEMSAEEALDAFEAHLLSEGATVSVAKLMREAVQLEDGQVLKFGEAGSFEADAGVVRRVSLPNGREAVVTFGETEPPADEPSRPSAPPVAIPQAEPPADRP